MTDTLHLGLPRIDAAQAQKHVTHNEALRVLDALVMLAVLDRDLSAPPVSPAEGDRYIVKAAGSGAFFGKDNQIAHYADGGWHFYPPGAGWLCYVADENRLAAWTGSAWSSAIDVIGGVSELQNLNLLGVGTAADSTNPLSAKLNNTLWAAKTVAEGGDGNLRYKLSKESAAKTLSFLFQDNFSGRAEVGLTGDDDFHFKTSADGSAWVDALLFDKTTGATKINAGFFLTGDISPAALSADQNDWTPAGLSTASMIRADGGAAARNITGLGGGGDGRLLAIVNAGTNNVVLVDESASSTAANRFALGGNVTLAPKQSAILIYDATTAHWRCIGVWIGAGGGGGGSGTVTSITAGTGLSGGTITTSGTIALDINGLVADAIAAGDFVPFYDISGADQNKITFANFNAALDHNTLTNFTANKHIDHSAVTITGAGALTGGGDLTASRTLDVAAAGVTYAKIQNVSATDKALGRVSAGAGSVEEFTVTAAARTLLDDATTGAMLTTLGALPLAGGAMTGALTLNADPTAALHAATKQYVDAVAQGLDTKPSVLCATTANITLSGEQTIDGQTTSAARVGVKNQTAPAENGIYVSAAGAWARATDMDAWSEVPGAFMFVEKGALNADTGWVCTADAGGALGATAMTWAQFSGAGTYSGATGITLTGTQFTLDTAHARNVDHGAVSVIAGNGLTGGGTIAADRTINVGAGAGILANADDVAIDKASTAQVLAATSNKVLTADNLAAALGPVALTDGATINVDLSVGVYFTVTLGGNRTIANPTNHVVGRTIYLKVTQDATGSRTLSYGTQYDFGQDSAPALTTTASEGDLLAFFVSTTSKLVYLGIRKGIVT
jgi:hypothetical protein